MTPAFWALLTFPLSLVHWLNISRENCYELYQNNQQLKFQFRRFESLNDNRPVFKVSTAKEKTLLKVKPFLRQHCFHITSRCNGYGAIIWVTEIAIKKTNMIQQQTSISGTIFQANRRFWKNGFDTRWCL